LFYNGLLLLPFLVFVFSTYFKNTTRLQKIIIIPMAIIFSLSIISVWRFIPVANVLYNLGVGPKVLKDAYWGKNLHPVLSENMLLVIKIIGTLGVSLLTFYFLTAISNFKKVLQNSGIKINIETENNNFENIVGNKFQFTIKFISLAVIISFSLFLLLGNYFFDRYLLFLFPFTLILFLPASFTNSKIGTSIAIVFLLINLFFSVSATHDYLAWNRARWTGLDSLTNSGISPSEIDGGFEFNGWYETNTRNPGNEFEKSWWFVNQDKYVVAFGDLCGYKKINKYLFNSYLTFSKDSIFILQKIETVNDSILIFCNAENTKNINNLDVMTTNDSTKFCEIKNTRTDVESFSGKFALKLDKNNAFGFTIRLNDIIPCETIIVSTYTKYNCQNAHIVASAPDANYFYTAKTVSDTINFEEWKYIEMIVNVPADFIGSELDFYVWNNSDYTVFSDDFKILRLR